MTSEELCTKLYQCMAAEQEHYRKWLLGQSPADILDHAAEYIVREDIVMEMEELELPEVRARALLKSKPPLTDVYREWSKTENHHMDDVWDVIENRAKAVIQTEIKKDQLEGC